MKGREEERSKQGVKGCISLCVCVCVFPEMSQVSRWTKPYLFFVRHEVGTGNDSGSNSLQSFASGVYCG